MKNPVLTATAILILFSTIIFGQIAEEDKLTLNSSKNSNDKVIFKDEISAEKKYNVIPNGNKLYTDLKYEADKFEAADFNLQQKKKKKSLGLGILLSALLPGAGEFYGEDYLKAGIFFAVEMLAWGTYFYFDGKGNSKTDEYYAYADQNWSVRTYASWLKDEGFTNSGGIDPNEPDLNILREQIMECERSNFSHTMPEYGSQQFYELIGKYQNFQAGWTNLANRPTRLPGPYFYETYRDPVFTNYAAERQTANDFYDYAKIGPITAILNHILSAADAAWTINTYNNRLTVQTGFRMENKISPYTYEVKQIPTFNLSVNF